jgi:recombination protein RecA
MKADVLELASDPRFVVKYIPTGVVPIDILMGGGVPYGRSCEIYGDYSTLKSYIGYRVIAEAQRRRQVAALIDTEHVYDEEWGADCGIDNASLILAWPETGELALDAVEALVRAGVSLVVIDSVSGLLPQADRSKRLHAEDPKIAALASLMSIGMRKITAPNRHTALLFINQMRTNIGVMFGNPDHPTGGRALPFYASMRVQIKKTGKITRDVQFWDGKKLATGKELIAQEYRASLDKSKLNRPHREIRFAWSLTDGSVDEVAFYIAQAIELGLVTVKGSMWRMKHKSVRGRDAFARYVGSTPVVFNQLRNEVLAAHGIAPKKGLLVRP